MTPEERDQDTALRLQSMRIARKAADFVERLIDGTASIVITRYKPEDDEHGRTETVVRLALDPLKAGG